MSNITQFILDVIEDCTTRGVTVNLVPESKIKIGIGDLSGVWDEEDMSISVAVLNDDWVKVLAHEYSHFCQFKDCEFATDEENAAFNDIDEWLENKIELSKEQIDSKIKIIQDCELDCEKRTVELIKKYNLDKEKNISKYIQRSNAYVLSYEILKTKRKWFDSSAHGRRAVISKMPKDFVSDYSISEDLKELMIKECYDD